jgi:hypothetical protein
MTEITVWRTIDVVAFGRRLHGSYAVEGNTVRVRTRLGEQTAELWDSVPASVARHLLILQLAVCDAGHLPLVIYGTPLQDNMY